MTLNEATRRQISAARPDISTWVSANAGSGKTKVLTDRVARLLLNGTHPQHILCLTYTKAAAAEMQNRLFERLGEWAMMPNEELTKELTALSPDKTLDPDTLRHARTLFARAIETPGGLKIQTIHSFCSALLRRFPLEAGVSPQFKEMDARQSNRIIADVLEELAMGAGREVIDAAAFYVKDLDLNELAQKIVTKREGFWPARTRDEIWPWFGLTAGFDDAVLLGEVVLGGEREMFLTVANLLETSGANDQKLAPFFRNWARLEPNLAMIEECCGKLLFGETSKTNPFGSKFGATRGGLPAKALREAHVAALRPLEEFMKRIEAIRPKLMALYDAKRTHALHQFAQALLPLYLKRKEQLGLLDFDDMIRRARDLLSISNVSQWVLYRLDGGIDHILVDEAQDTSPDQWTVVRLLAGEFTAGEGARPDVTRTIFVVGDHKQSIYSFQGAAPEAFDEMKAHFGARLSAVGQPLQDLALQHSFRSSKAILQATDAVFRANNGVGVGGATDHIAFFDGIPGRVDVWPLIELEESAKDPEDWQNPVDIVTPEHHTAQLAKQVADFVADLLKNGAIPEKAGKSRAVKPGDVMILVRSRSDLFGRILRTLKSHPARIPVAGADRLTLNDELAVKDIRSLLAFLSLQDDDLALAEVLKSPLFNWSERDLYRLAHGRTTITLWRALFERQAEWPETFSVLNDLRQVADFLRPYDLIERVLIRHDGRRKLIARLGKEAEDGIDALLHQARSYETVETPSLTGFIAWLEAQEIELKRVLDEKSNLVRVMTVHGSKGLEAPIVILPDTLKNVKESRDEIVVLGDDQMVWKGPKEQRSEALYQSLIEQKQAEFEEDRRLLYVAMTRAEKWLVVCGAGQDKPESDAWYNLVRRGFENLPAEKVEFGPGSGLRFSHGIWPDLAETEQTAPAIAPKLPAWWGRPAPELDLTESVLSPSDLGGAKALPGEGALLDKDAAMRRGSQLHKLIETLPGVSVERQTEVARFVLSSEETGVLEEELPSLLSEVRNVLSGTYDWDVFGANSLAEVEYRTKLKGFKIHGYIDRLIVAPDRIQIIDYKSNALTPNRAENTPEGILRQLGAYAKAMNEIYPDRNIETAVLWTKTATLMPIPHEIVREALSRATIS